MCFKICIRGVRFRIKVWFLCFSILTLFVISFQIEVFEVRLWTIFKGLNFRVKDLKLKKSLQSPKNKKHQQNN